MGKLILVRHGESVGNRAQIFTTTPHELALTELGHEQAREAGLKIAKLFRAELVVSSPYIRARETARIIAEILKLPVEVEPQLHERDVGSLKGQPYESVFATRGYDPKRPWLWQPPDGESFEQVKARVSPVLDRLAATHPSRDIVVVSHGGVMMALWAHVTGVWDNAHVPPNCGIILVEHDRGGYSQPQIIGKETLEKFAGG
jgi:ribonuclease H / adenosylcobalamin/alpha-ribazole phosphatase